MKIKDLENEDNYYYWVGQCMEIEAHKRGYKNFNDCHAKDPELSKTIVQQAQDTIVGIYKKAMLGEEA